MVMEKMNNLSPHRHSNIISAVTERGKVFVVRGVSVRASMV